MPIQSGFVGGRSTDWHLDKGTGERTVTKHVNFLHAFNAIPTIVVAIASCNNLRT
jgi:hypothetical protein